MSQNLLGNKKSFLVIEITIIIAIAALALSSLLQLTSFSMSAANLLSQTSRAEELLQETMESVRNFRDGTVWNSNGLGTLLISSDYFPQKSGSPQVWQMTPGIETMGIYQRKVIFEQVLRDASSNIVQSGGIIDPNTKKIRAIISWTEKGRNHSLEIAAYLTNWRK